MSDKLVSIEPANAGEDETKPEVELVAKRKTIAPVWKILDLKWMRKASHDRLTVQSAACVNMKWQPKMETFPISTAI